MTYHVNAFDIFEIDALPTRMTDSARLRLGNMRRSLQEADDAIRKEKEKDKARSERKKSLAMKVQQKAALNESTGTTATSGDDKLRQYKYVCWCCISSMQDHRCHLKVANFNGYCVFFKRQFTTISNIAWWYLVATCASRLLQRSV